jgi:hypothetical protein
MRKNGYFYSDINYLYTNIYLKHQYYKNIILIMLIMAFCHYFFQRILLNDLKHSPFFLLNNSYPNKNIIRKINDLSLNCTINASIIFPIKPAKITLV